MATSGKAILAILAGKGKPMSAGKGGMMGKGMEDEGDSDDMPGEGEEHDDARETLKEAAGWDDDVLDALHEYIKSCMSEEA